MSTQILASGTAALKAKKVARRTATFHPSVWGDRFLNYNPENPIIYAQKEHQVKEVKDEVRRQLIASANEISQQLNLIDAIQRLGVAYHFEREIEEALRRIYKTYMEYADESDLHNVSLLFRLLRQERFDVSCDIFNKFKDDKGNLNECLNIDVKGMLSLYEVAHLMKHGEDILEEAKTFTVTHLALMGSHDPSNPLTPQIAQALKQPLHKGMPRVEARQFIFFCEQDALHNKALLNLAKLDFNQLQSLHRKELSEIARWWKDLDFANKLPYARDRVVEGYFWTLGVYFEPQYLLSRKIISKVFAILSVIDDTYDAYGTIDELERFTEAIERWDISFKDRLPDYMKLCYQVLLDIFDEIEEAMRKQDQSDCVQYVIKAMKNLAKGYFLEAKWLQQNYVPTMEEYMGNTVSAACYMLQMTSFVGMGEIVTKEAFDWISKDPMIASASSIVGRLMNDIASHKFEQERGHVASAMECYMNQYNVTEEQTKDELLIRIANAWKDINEEFLRNTDVPLPLLIRILNLTRTMDVIYKFGQDRYTHVGTEMKKHIVASLVDPVPM